jgi:hypothetical protein
MFIATNLTCLNLVSSRSRRRALTLTSVSRGALKFHKSKKWLGNRTPEISGFESVLLHTSGRGEKASFIFGHKCFGKKPDLLFPRISDFIQNYFLRSGAFLLAEHDLVTVTSGGTSLLGDWIWFYGGSRYDSGADWAETDLRVWTTQELACFMNFLGLLLMLPIAIAWKTFPPTLALTANQFTMLFNYVSLAVTRNTNHFNLLEDSAYGAIERVPLPNHCFLWFSCFALIHGE